VKLDSVDECVPIDRTGVGGAPAHRLAVGLARSPDILFRNCHERDELNRVGLDLAPRVTGKVVADADSLNRPGRRR
jgi:hypothetical protein